MTQRNLKTGRNRETQKKWHDSSRKAVKVHFALEWAPTHSSISPLSSPFNPFLSLSLSLSPQASQEILCEEKEVVCKHLGSCDTSCSLALLLRIFIPHHISSLNLCPLLSSSLNSVCCQWTRWRADSGSGQKIHQETTIFLFFTLHRLLRPASWPNELRLWRSCSSVQDIYRHQAC